MRTAKELLIASREFAGESYWRSRWHLWSTLGSLVGLLTVAVWDFSWILRGVASIVAGLVCVRMFIIYHDYQHGAILQNSFIAGCLMWIYGLVTLNPPSVWNRSHNDHHKNNSKSFGANVGSYPVMTTSDYADASLLERFVYASARHPMTMAFGYLTVFFWRMSLRPFLVSPKLHVDGAIAVLLHIAIIACLGMLGLDVLLFGLILPLFVASLLGAYLFYAQHNFPTAKLRRSTEWNQVDAALNASSFMCMGPVMHWFTGNIGYHHVHHLNARIPFYRLPETMNALEELQSPGRTSLRWDDIMACLRLKLWCPEQEKFVSFRGI